jgi:hypothetical protein
MPLLYRVVDICEYGPDQNKISAWLSLFGSGGTLAIGSRFPGLNLNVVELRIGSNVMTPTEPCFPGAGEPVL